MIIDSVSQLIGLHIDEIKKISRKAPRTYKRYTVPKSNGGERVIYQPSRETKSLQYALITLIIKGLPVHDIAMAYRPGMESPQKKTAEKHAPYNYSLRVDFRNFFYSIKPRDFFNCLEVNDREYNELEKEFITKSLFINHHGKFKLAIGAPSSPFISNAVVYTIDQELVSLAREIDADSSLTRYADDIVFSTDEKGRCKDFLERTRLILDDIESPDLNLNESKTTFMSRGTKRMVAGLILTPDGDVSIGRSKKRALRSWLNDLKYGNLDDEGRARLQGYLAWVKDVEPELLNNLSLKYSSNLINKAMGNIS